MIPLNAAQLMAQVVRDARESACATDVDWVIVGLVLAVYGSLGLVLLYMAGAA